MSQLPKAIRSGRFWLGNVELICHVLDNGQRVIDAEGINRWMQAMNDGTWTISDDEAKAVAQALRGDFEFIDADWDEVPK